MKIYSKLNTLCYYFLVFFFSLVSLTAFSQNKEKIDSLLHILETPKLDTLTVYAYCDLASELVGTDNKQAKAFALKGLQVSKSIKNKEMEAWSNHVTGLTYDYLGIADSALFYYERSIEIKKGLKDVEGEATSNLNIGVLFFYQKEYDKAEVYFKKALQLYETTNNEKRIASALNNIGAIYRIQEKYDDAIAVYNQAYELKVKTFDSVGISNAMGNLAIVYQYKGDYEKAEQLYLKTLALQKLTKDKNNQINLYGNLANLKIQQGKYEAGKQYLDNAIALGNVLEVPHEMIEIYRVYSVIDTLTGNYKAAYHHLKLYHEANDKVIQTDRTKEMDKLEVVYRTKEKEKAIETSNTIIKNRNKALWVISSILAILLVLAFWLFWLRYKLHKSNKQLNVLVKQKEDLVKEIHHRVKNNLQVISSLLNMHVRKVEDPQSKKIFDDGISRIQAMSLIHQNIYSHSSLQQLKPKDYIEKLVQQLFITYQIPDKSIKITTDIEDMDLDIEKLMSLGLILNEILSNAFKYAFNGS
ncbi:tetratricopeptide repeat protein, partial [Winogradskyella sp.]|uniref:tetratricopeptide repeat-containing sensor histidine kinase n=1 Tax=Winogradskyella sp. TaxID=1883156 RepID=UPI003AB67873